MEAEPQNAQLDLQMLAQQASSTEDASEGLQNFIARCKGQIQHLSEGTANAALQTLASLVYTCIQQHAMVSPDLLPTLLEFIAAWHQKGEATAEQALLLLEDAFKHLHNAALLPPSPQFSEVALKLVQLQAGFSIPSLRAVTFRSLNELAQVANVHACDERLQHAVEVTLAALAVDLPAVDGPRFCLLVFAASFLSPLSDSLHTFPNLPTDYADSLLDAADFVIKYLKRHCEDLSQGVKCDCGISHTPVRVQEHHILIFFGTLPRLQSAFAHRGVASADDEGNTIAHRLADANLPKCLNIYLHGCGAHGHRDLHAPNIMGKTPAELAIAAGANLCLEVLREHQAHASLQANALVSRAMARASSVPSLPICQGEGNSHAPSFSYIEPDTNSANRSQETRLQKFEAQAGGMALQAGAGNTASLPLAGPLDERRRILQMALAQLESASQRSHSESDRSQPASSTAYFCNPAQNLPVHSNPFAGFSETHGQANSHLLDRTQYGMPAMGALRASSTGSTGLEGSSPPQNSLDFRPRSFEDGLRNSRRATDWESSTTPSTRMWLGNIAAHVTVRSLYDVFGRFGQLTDAAVFPARIGPLGYAFVNFLDVGDAARAYDALNNTPVPPLTGSKLLKIRYKPAQQQPKPVGESMENIVAQPSSHLWLGNVLTRPNKLAIEELFCQFGTLTSVRVFPGKTFAFVNYSDVTEAANAMRFLDGRMWPIISGTKPMVVRYQTGPQLGLPMQEQLGLRNMSVPAMLGMAPPAAPVQSFNPGLVGSMLQQPSAGNLASLTGIMPDMRHSSLPVLTMPSSTPAQTGLTPNGFSTGMPVSPDGITGLDQSELGELGIDGLLPAINLSNRLNPNNMHYDKDLAELYKSMTKAEKEALWADDRSTQYLLAMQGDQLPTDLSMLGIPPQQAALLANHLAGVNGAIDPWASAGLAAGSQQSLWGGSLPLQSPSPSLLGHAQQGLDSLTFGQAQRAGLPSLSNPAISQMSLAPSTSTASLMQSLAGQSCAPTSLSEVLSSYGLGHYNLHGSDLQPQQSRGLTSPGPDPSTSP